MSDGTLLSASRISGSSGTRSLTIGQGDFGSGNYRGSIQNGAAGTTALTKTGTVTITFSGTNSYTGAMAINLPPSSKPAARWC